MCSESVLVFTTQMFQVTPLSQLYLLGLLASYVLVVVVGLLRAVVGRGVVVDVVVLTFTWASDNMKLASLLPS